MKIKLKLKLRAYLRSKNTVIPAFQFPGPYCYLYPPAAILYNYIGK